MHRAGALAEPADVDPHAAGCGELQRVADEVEQHLAQPLGIAGDIGGHVGRDLVPQLEPLRLRSRGEQRHRRVHQLAQVERGLLEVEPARVQPGEVEDVVDQLQQALPLSRMMRT